MHLRAGQRLRRNADFDWAGAEADSRRAVELAPGDGGAKFSLGVSLATFGKPREAIALTRQAIEINPLRASWDTWLASYLASLGRLDEAEAAIRKSIALQPDGTGYYQLLTMIQIQRGDAKAALTYVAKSEEYQPGETAHAINLAVLALAQHQLQPLDESRIAFAGATQFIDGLRAMPNRKGDHDLLIAEMLLREAASLLDAKAN